MMACTDRHARFFLRLFSQHTVLYTEMITANALIYGDAGRHLDFDAAEHPLAAQLGGCDPAAMAAAARMVEQWGYDEVNINVGCPSDRVRCGQFGAALMAKPALVADCAKAMRDAVSIPVTVKTRIGIDHQDSYEELTHFIATVAATGVGVFIIHARKAWLHGLSPKQNREIPPLRYDVVHRLKQDFPQLIFIINGGFKTLDECARQLNVLNGVMMGREAYANPYMLAGVDGAIFDTPSIPLSREQAVVAMVPYVAAHVRAGGRVAHAARHMLGLFQGVPGARLWRRMLSAHMYTPGADERVLINALDAVRQFLERHAA